MLFQLLGKFLCICCCFASAPHAFPSSSSRLLTPMQGPGCCVLSKTRLTVQETAGIPIWSPADSCSAYAASAQRCLFKLSPQHFQVPSARFLEWRLFAMWFLFQKGHVKCNTIKCPALSCENPVVEPQQCCPKCTGPMFFQRLDHLKRRKKMKDVQHADSLCPLQAIRSGSPQGWELLPSPAGTTELFISQERPSVSATSSHPSRVTSASCAHAL